MQHEGWESPQWLMKILGFSCPFNQLKTRQRVSLRCAASGRRQCVAAQRAYPSKLHVRFGARGDSESPEGGR